MQPFFARLDSSLESGLEGWQRAAARVDSELEQVVALHAQGFNNTEIAKKLSIDKSTVGRRLTTAKAQGLVEEIDGEQHGTPEPA